MIFDELALCAEWQSALQRMQACRPEDRAHTSQIRDLPEQIIRDNFVGLAAILVDGEHYQPIADGSPAFVTPAWHGLRLIDLVAWHPANPGHHATRYGVCDMLGEEAWERTLVWRSVYSWLRASCLGLVVLDPLALGWLTTEALVAEDAAHQRELQRALLRPVCELPRVLAA